MLEGSGNIHFLITIFFGSNSTFFGTVSGMELKNLYYSKFFSYKCKVAE